MSSEEEKKPLLSSTNPTPSAPPVEQPPPYEQPTLPAPLPESNGSALPGQQPPPYSTVNAAGGMSGQTMFVQCRVCQHVIHVSSESHTRVVKCSNCREATVSTNVKIEPGGGGELGCIIFSTYDSHTQTVPVPQISQLYLLVAFATGLGE